MMPDRQWWKCDCGKTLGEIAGERVIIKINGRTIVVPFVRIEQTCSCGRTIVLVSGQDKEAA